MAIWIEQTVVNGQVKSGAKPDGMCGMAPRGDNLSASELVWRDFVLNVQRHDCYTKKCFTKRGETVDDCKYGYPRRLFSDSALTALDDPACGLDIPFAFPCTNMKKNISTDRYEIRSDQPEDQRLSPYVPLWLQRHVGLLHDASAAVGRFCVVRRRGARRWLPAGEGEDGPRLRAPPLPAHVPPLLAGDRAAHRTGSVATEQSGGGRRKRSGGATLNYVKRLKSERARRRPPFYALASL